MAKPEAMTLMNISINKPYVEDLINEILSLRYVHLIPTTDGKDDKKEKTGPVEIFADKDLKAIQANLSYIAGNLKLNFNEIAPLKKPINFKVNSLKSLMSNILVATEETKRRLVEYKDEIKHKNDELRNLTISKEFYAFLKENCIDIDKIKTLTMFTLVSFYGHKNEINNFYSTASSIPGLDSTVYQSKNITINKEENSFVYCFVESSMEDTLIETIKESNCKVMELNPKYFKGNEFDVELLKEDTEDLEDDINDLLEQVELIKKVKVHELTAFNEIAENLEIIKKMENDFYVSNKPNIIKLDAYIPSKLEKDIVNKLNRKYGKNILITVQRIERELITEEEHEPESESDKEDESKSKDHLDKSKPDKTKKPEAEKEHKEESKYKSPPTLIKHNFLVRPFKMLVDLYGMTNYAEIDPTFFVAITFPLFFGLMFGDVGHGLVLVVCGLLLMITKRKDQTMRDFGQIVLYCGLGSIFAGFLYGEFFGRHLIINGQDILLLARPMDKFTLLIRFVVLIGVVHLSLGWLIKFGNFWTNNRKFLAFADPFLKILGLVGGTYLIFTYMFDINAWLTPQPGLFGLHYVPFLYPALPGILLIFSKAIGKIFKVPYLQKESAGALVGEGVIESGETYLSILSNVASYTRLLALALAHIGFMVVVEQMAAMAPPFLDYFILIFGNVFVIILEGILAAIQALRLHLYEFFGKFYLADGYQFETITLHSKYSHIEFVPLETNEMPE